MAKDDNKVKVTFNALKLRLNRHLAKEDCTLRVARGPRMIQDVGEYYIVNLSHNAIWDKHIDPEEYARDVGVLKPYEVLSD
jgi:hypothetical protein